MRSVAWALLLLSSLLLTSGREPERRVIEVTNAGELMELFATPLNNVIVQLAPGRYDLVPRGGFGVTRGACNDTEHLPMKFGLLITGRSVRVAGPTIGEAILVANADTRLQFRQCIDCELDRVTITGESPSVGAAIFATDSNLRVENCKIDNASPLGATARGALNGIEGGANAVLEVRFNEIRGSTAGIALHGNAKAIVRNNLIEGVGGDFGGWGLLMMCDASAVVERNHMRNLAAGVLLEDEVALDLRANIVEDIHEVGIGSGFSLGRIRIERNILYGCGRAAIALRTDGDQRANGNIIVESGRIVPPESAIAVEGANADAAVRKNILYDNTVTDASLDRDVPREIFWRERRQWTRTYRNTPVGVDGRHKFHESAFLTRYGRWLH